MGKGVIKEIFLLIFEVIKALCEMLWKKIKGFIGLIWQRFFGMADVSIIEKAEEQEWGVTGEDKWPIAPEEPPVELKEAQPKFEQKEAVYVPAIPELPESYGDNRIVLMVIDPEWLFTYWEIRKDVLDSVLNSLGTLARSAKLVLRVYDVTDIIFNGNNAHKYFDIEVTGGAQSWYIYVGEPNRSFCADIGFLAPNGTFRILSRSNTARTPRASVSEVVDEKWMSIEELYEYEKVCVPTGYSISEFVFERAYRDWQKILKEGVSSPELLREPAVSKK